MLDAGVAQGRPRTSLCCLYNSEGESGLLETPLLHSQENLLSWFDLSFEGFEAPAWH